LRSAAPSEASRHFSQDRQVRAKFFVAQLCRWNALSSTRWKTHQSIVFGEDDLPTALRTRDAAVSARVRHRLKLVR